MYVTSEPNKYMEYLNFINVKMKYISGNRVSYNGIYNKSI